MRHSTVLLEMMAIPSIYGALARQKESGGRARRGWGVGGGGACRLRSLVEGVTNGGAKRVHEWLSAHPTIKIGGCMSS